MAVGSTRTMGGALLAARCVGFAAVVVLALLVFALTQKLELVPLVLLNPGLYQQSVIDAHNDILAVDMTLLALVLAKRSPIAATLTASLSGLVKINFSLIGSVLATSRFRSSKRLAVFALSFALTLLLSYLFSGYRYIGALAAISNEYVPKFGTASGAVGTLTHIALVPFAFAALTLVLLGFETPWSFVWSFPSLAVAVYPGYLIWGLPYALRDVNSTRFFLAALPLPSLMFNFVFPGSGDLMRIILLLYMAYEAFRLMRVRVRARSDCTTRATRSPS